MDGDDLPEPALDAVAACVRSVVRDQGDDPFYVWTRDHGRHGTVHLVVPPGPPAGWAVDAVRLEHAGPAAFDVVVAMWTVEEGRSDLALEVEVVRGDDGRWEATARDLHVR